jgi:hypothetical protein
MQTRERKPVRLPLPRLDGYRCPTASFVSCRRRLSVRRSAIATKSRAGTMRKRCCSVGHPGYAGHDRMPYVVHAVAMAHPVMTRCRLVPRGRALRTPAHVDVLSVHQAWAGPRWLRHGASLPAKPPPSL